MSVASEPEAVDPAACVHGTRIEVTDGHEHWRPCCDEQPPRRDGDGLGPTIGECLSCGSPVTLHCTTPNASPTCDLVTCVDCRMFGRADGSRWSATPAARPSTARFERDHPKAPASATPLVTAMLAARYFLMAPPPRGVELVVEGLDHVETVWRVSAPTATPLASMIVGNPHLRLVSERPYDDTIPPTQETSP